MSPNEDTPGSAADRRWLCMFALATGLAVVLGAAGPAAGWTEDIAKLPIGHVSITDRDDGTLNVTARCVPTRTLLDTLAERTGMPVVFEDPVYTYVTIYGAKPRPINEWMREVAWHGTCRIAVRDRKWVVTAGQFGEMDGTRTESEIIEKWSRPKPECIVPEDGIRDGILILNGHYIPAPYEIEVLDAGGGRWDVLVNGVVACSRPVPQPPPPEGFNTWAKYHNRPIEIPESGQFGWPSEELTLYSFRLYRDALNKALETQEREAAAATAKQHLLDFLNTQQFFIENGDPETVTVWDSKRELAKPILPHGVDPNTGRLFCPMSEGSPPSGETAARNEAAGLARTLSSFVLIANENLGRTTGLRGESFRDLADILYQSHDRNLFEREAMLTELGLCPDVARFLAVNLYADIDLLLPELRRLQAEWEIKQFPEHEPPGCPRTEFSLR